MFFRITLLFGLICFLSTSFIKVGTLSTPASIMAAADTEQNRFTKVVLAQKLEEPMQFELLKDGRVLFAERKGKLKMYSPVTGKVTIIAQIPVSTKYVSKQGAVSEGEDGLRE